MTEKLRAAHDEVTQNMPMQHLAPAMAGIYDCRAAALWLADGALPDGIEPKDFDEAGEILELGTGAGVRFATVRGLRAPETLHDDLGGQRTIRRIAMTRYVEQIGILTDWQGWPRGHHTPRITAIRAILAGNSDKCAAGIQTSYHPYGGWRIPHYLTVWTTWNAEHDGTICDVDPRSAETCGWLAQTAIRHLVGEGPDA